MDQQRRRTHTRLGVDCQGTQNSLPSDFRSIGSKWSLRPMKALRKPHTASQHWKDTLGMLCKQLHIRAFLLYKNKFNHSLVSVIIGITNSCIELRLNYWDIYLFHISEYPILQIIFFQCVLPKKKINKKKKQGKLRKLIRSIILPHHDSVFLLHKPVSFK